MPSPVPGNDWSRAAAIIESGGVVAFPTDTVFGLGCSIFTSQAIARILAIKGRSDDKGFPVLIASLEQAAALVEVNPTFRALAQVFWPGGLTIVAPALPSQPTAILAPDGTIGLRIPGSAAVRRLIEAAGCPIVGTSANRTGERPVSDATSAFEEFGDDVDYVLTGQATGAAPSTVVSVAHDLAQVLRVGAILPAKLQETIPSLVSPDIQD